ncbi:uncharacterized protein LOC123310211 [Coccinella septempunctata]|uniref:uncharacterized protein LOC123310211 n=1 Tax=Coccinella septempunctata TaxID=41139 RepID=UPI001D08ADC2|nr:uncharacterized protein LOC123310211 [Coccinella septempunctata]XP_044749587.1 uncharacterized protein LOC123310211 [Coccinella septempunctata]
MGPSPWAVLSLVVSPVRALGTVLWSNQRRYSASGGGMPSLLPTVRGPVWVDLRVCPPPRGPQIPAPYRGVPGSPPPCCRQPWCRMEDKSWPQRSVPSRKRQGPDNL